MVSYGDFGEGVWFIGKVVLRSLLVEFKVKGCKMFGVEDVSDGFDKVDNGLFCWVLGSVVGVMFFCLVVWLFYENKKYLVNVLRNWELYVNKVRNLKNMILNWNFIRNNAFLLFKDLCLYCIFLVVFVFETLLIIFREINCIIIFFL